MRREEKFTDQKSLNISSLHTDYLNLDSSSSGSSRHSERAHYVQSKCSFCERNNNSAEKCFKNIKKEKEKARAVDVSSNRNSERPTRKCFRCGYEDHMIAKCPKPPRDNEKRRRMLSFNEKKVIVHATMAKITTTIRYMHIWHECLAMTNVQVKSMVTVHN